TALAAMVEPRAAAKNLQRLAARGLLGRYGFYEAVDYTPRKPDAPKAPGREREGVVVRAHLAHHQGMTMMALANVVDHDRNVARFHADARIQSTELLLQERVPQGIAIHEPRPDRSSRLAPPLPPLSTPPFRS